MSFSDNVVYCPECGKEKKLSVCCGKDMIVTTKESLKGVTALIFLFYVMRIIRLLKALVYGERKRCMVKPIWVLKDRHFS